MKTKTQFTNRILSFVLSIMMVVSMLPMNILTANAAETTESAIDLSTLTGTYVISDSGEYTFTGSGSYGIKVESGNPTIVLNNANITVGEGSAIDIASGSDATIFVQDDNSLSTTAQYSSTTAGGIFVAEGGTVNITSNSTNNTLRVTGNTAAAIGGKYIYAGESYNAGNINISNVTVYAYTNNYYAAAIGAAGEGTCGTINITNAVVYAYGAGDRWTSAPGIGSAWSLVGWPETIPIVIISDSEVHTFRYNPYSDYIGYLGDESGDTYATGSINCGDGGSVKNSTIYCYTGLDATTTDKVVKYGALGGLLKEDGTCEGEHSGGTATCTTLAVCENCGASYGDLGDHSIGADGKCVCGLTFWTVEGNTLTIDGTLGGKTTAEESDITALLEAIKGYVDSGITTIIVTGSKPAKIEVGSFIMPAVSEALYRLTNETSDSPYCGTIDLILPDVTEIVDDEFNNTYALNSITLPKVTTVGDGAFYATGYLQTLTFGSVITFVNEESSGPFHMDGYYVGGCDLVLNCGQLQAEEKYKPNLETNVWFVGDWSGEYEWKSITLTHTEATAATCIAKATCSVCDEEYGEVDTNAHSYGDWDSNGDGTHTRTCAIDPAHTESGDCSGGTATCTTLAVCDLCGESYGELGGHSFDDESKCTVCGTACTHKTFTDGKCPCGLTGGYCGAATNEGGEESVIWTYDEVTKAFAITGTGAMQDYNSYSDRPWDESISENATSVTISEGVTRIGKRAFQNFRQITAVTVPASVESIGSCAFTGCDAMQSITFAEGSRLTAFDSFVFQNCFALEQITLPAGVTSVNSSVFWGCNALTDIFVEEGSTTLKDIDGVLYTADGTTLLRYPIGKDNTAFTTPAGVTAIGEQAFQDNVNLKTITLSEGVTTIGAQAFWWMESLTTVTIPSSVTSIAYAAFESCDKLTTINAPCNWDTQNPLYTFDSTVAVIVGDHTPNVDGYTDNENGTHSFTCSKCGYAVTEEHTLLTCSASGNVITGSCSKCPAVDTATITAENTTYTGTAQETATVAYSAGWKGGELTVSYANNVNAGTATASITLGEATASVEFTIAKAKINIDDLVNPEFAENLVYDGTKKALVTAHGYVPGGTILYSLTYDGEYTSTIPVATEAGRYGVYWLIQGDENHEDILSPGWTQVIIAAKPGTDANVTLGEYDSVYSGTAKEPGIASVVVDGVTLTAGKDYDVSYENNVYAGTAKAVITFKGNYSGTATETFQISKAPLTVTADDKSMTTGRDLPAFTYTITGFVNGETEAVLTTKPTVSCEADGQTAGTYDITVSGAEAANYDITHVNGTLSVVDHQHAWTYTADGDTITATCNAEGCPDAEQSITISAVGKIYDGTPVTATLNGSIDGVATPEITYTGNTNAGTHTASITIEGETASVKFTIEKATVTVTADAKSKPYGYEDPTLTYTSEGLLGDDVLTGALTREEGENAGSYAITLGTLTAGDNYTISFTGAELTITDGTEPTGSILIKENGWNKFWNTITFGIFCKDYVDVTITADGTGSGVAKVEYLLSDTALGENNIPTEGWTEISNNNGKYSFSIKPQNKVAVYVRITDEGGNVTVINSDGIVVYEDSKAVDTEVTYTYKENSNKDIAVEFNGNTVNSIVYGEKVLAANSDYSVDYESGKIVLKATYLDTLNAGDYTYTVSYNPMGVENSGVTDLTTTFIVKVEPTSIDGAAVNVSATFTYDGNAKTPDPMVVLNGETLVKDRDYTVSYAENVNAGTATVTVTGNGNYSGTASGSFRIDRAKLTNISVQQNGKLTYNGEALTPAVTANATALNGAKVYFIYSADGSVYGSMPTFTDAGTYTVYYCAYTVDNNFFDHHDTFTVTIDKATVTEPTIASKPYSGSAQTADISGTDLYTVEKNNGGTEKGSYDVVLKLKDSANYKWSTTDTSEVTLQFVISAAQNAWDTNPSISGWTYGEAAKTPVGTAKYGAVKVVYTGKANDGTDYNSVAAPTEAGSYTATFIVQETEDYKGLETSVDFTIAKKAVTVTANDASKTYGESDPALTYTHTELVGSDALVITVARTSGENANTYTITASQAEGANPNYEITFKTGTFTIHKATLIVTVEDKTATYGDPVPTYTVKYEGFKNGDDKDDLGGELAFYQTYNQFDDAGKYDIMPYGLSSDNYIFSYNFGKLTVNAKPITVTIQNATSVYGDTLAELKATDNGIVNGDTNVYSLATTATGTSNVGKYAITGTTLDSNYLVTFVNSEYEITKREITITVDAKNTVVNTTLPTYTYKVEGLVGVDTLVTEPTLTCNANIALIGEYDITASGADAGGNYSIKYVPAKLTVLTDNAVDAAAGYTEELKDYDPATVTSEDKAELEEMLSEINTILADETTTDNGKKALEEVKEQVEKLIKEITDAAEATDTENTEKVENVTPENVIPENKTDLEGAKADLEKALEDNGGNYTEDEKKAIEAEIKRIDDALEVIGNVEAVEKVISKLPAVDTVKPDDEEAIKAITDAQTAYNALSDYEKSLVDEATKANLDKLVAALVAYDIVEGDGSSWTEDSDHNITFVANGLFSKFVGIKVDGKDVDKANYEAKAGSTIITLKASYLDTLAVGEHTITVVYTDGSTDGAFNVHAKANSPATGDDFNITLYASLMAVSVTALVVLLLASKKRKQVK